MIEIFSRLCTKFLVEICSMEKIEWRPIQFGLTEPFLSRVLYDTFLYAVLLMKFTRSRTDESLYNLSRVRFCHAQQLKSVEMVIESIIIRNDKPRRKVHLFSSCGKWSIYYELMREETWLCVNGLSDTNFVSSSWGVRLTPECFNNGSRAST